MRHEFTRLVARLEAVFVALVILTGCAAREGVLLVSWMPPTTNANGGPLKDLASYRIYFNTTGGRGPLCPGGRLFVNVDAAVVGRTPDGRVSVILSNFVVGQIYNVAVTAVNSRGEESDCSNIVSAPARLPDKE